MLLCPYRSERLGKNLDIIICGKKSFFFVYFLNAELTPETAPASHVAGSGMIQDITRSGEASGLDGTVQANRAGELDQGNVIAGTSEKNTAFQTQDDTKKSLEG